MSAVNEFAIAAIVSLLVLAGATASENGTVAGAEEDTPRYTAAGDLQMPGRFREWIFLSSGMDMSYNPVAAAAGHSTFENVFVNPAAYRSFLQSGTWPDKTMFMLEVRAAAGATSINKNGQTQSEQVLGRQLHVKDARLDGGWGFFAVEDSGMGKPVAKAKGTVSSTYLADEKAARAAR